jgi:hypothetical protein
VANLTVTGQVAAVMALSVPSVEVMSPAAPAQVSTAQLPVLFVRNAKIVMSDRSLSGGKGGLSPIAFEICVIVEAVRQGNQVDTYAKSRLIMDELAAAIEASSLSLRLDSCSIFETFESASNETAYFAVIAELSMS